ncbi:hypothetical protein QJS10_CPB12g00705 [Acorus calamus]|uniref:Uncharacterized protein n=1 Tax=Acorus calamus TaxID=4465 RepID=A0AAV9DL37_ACOCL|nr:hypothetical protein QJS10_CPB12g00705 [Acorus calamus]
MVRVRHIHVATCSDKSTDLCRPSETHFDWTSVDTYSDSSMDFCRPTEEHFDWTLSNWDEFDLGGLVIFFRKADDEFDLGGLGKPIASNLGQADQRYEELCKDFKANQSRPSLSIRSPMLEYASEEQILSGGGGGGDAEGEGPVAIGFRLLFRSQDRDDAVEIGIFGEKKLKEFWGSAVEQELRLEEYIAQTNNRNKCFSNKDERVIELL